MWTAYLDESGLDEKSQVFCVAGYVAHPVQWFELSRAWNRVLEGAGINAFHMTDFENRQGPYKGWPDTTRLEFISELVSIINSTELWGIATGINREAWARVTAGPPPTPIHLSWWRHPFILAFQDVLCQSARLLVEQHVDETVAFVVDQQATFQARGEAVHKNIQEGSWAHAHRLGSLTFRSKVGCPPLQAADLCAYEVRKAYESKFTASSRPERRSMARLRSRMTNPRYFDEDTLRQHIVEA